MSGRRFQGLRRFIELVTGIRRTQASLLKLRTHHRPMQIDPYAVTPVALPVESGVCQLYKATNLADAYAVTLPESTITNPELLARFIFAQQSPWISALMRSRDTLVAGFGLKTSGQLMKAEGLAKANRIGMFKIYSTSTYEIILGEDDKHLDFRLSLLYQPRPSAVSSPHLILSTVVHCHNHLGRAYIFIIAPFHRLIVQSMLRRASRTGWPKVTST